MNEQGYYKNLSIIVAQSKNHVIGLDGTMPWHLSADLKHFKTITMGHTVVMGRKTWLSLPKRPLVGRKNIVLTTGNITDSNDVLVLHSLEELFEYVENHAAEELFIIGGGSIYKALMPKVGRLYITWIHHDFQGDTLFPDIDMNLFSLTNTTEVMTDESSSLPYCFAQYDRK